MKRKNITHILISSHCYLAVTYLLYSTIMLIIETVYYLWTYNGSVCKHGDLTILKKMLIFAPCKERAQFVNLGI